MRFTYVDSCEKLRDVGCRLALHTGHNAPPYVQTATDKDGPALLQTAHDRQGWVRPGPSAREGLQPLSRAPFNKAIGAKTICKGGFSEPTILHHATRDGGFGEQSHFSKPAAPQLKVRYRWPAFQAISM